MPHHRTGRIVVFAEPPSVDAHLHAAVAAQLYHALDHCSAEYSAARSRDELLACALGLLCRALRLPYGRISSLLNQQRTQQTPTHSLSAALDAGTRRELIDLTVSRRRPQLATESGDDRAAVDGPRSDRHANRISVILVPVLLDAEHHVLEVWGPYSRAFDTTLIRPLALFGSCVTHHLDALLTRQMVRALQERLVRTTDALRRTADLAVYLRDDVLSTLPSNLFSARGLLTLSAEHASAEGRAQLRRELTILAARLTELQRFTGVVESITAVGLE